MRRLRIALLQSLLVVAAATLVTVMMPVPAGAATAVMVDSRVNGVDANTAPGLLTQTGKLLQWEIWVVNTGTEALTSVVTTDDHGLSVMCPITLSLEPGSVMHCTAGSFAVAGLHQHIFTTTAVDAQGTTVRDDDSTWYFAASLGLDLQALVNGEDADIPPGPGIPAGSTVLWTFVVTNVGDAELTAVAVWTDSGMAVTCPKTSLQPAESMTCTAASVAAAGPQSLLALVTGTWQSWTVTRDDPANWIGLVPQVWIETLVNGVDADSAPGLEILSGSPLLWTYLVTNSGSLTVNSVAVTDNQGQTVTCPKTSLAPGESMTCTAASTAVAGLHGLVGSVAADSVGGAASDDDPAWYTGLTEGCSPGFWKKHTGDWPPTGYSPGQKVWTVFPNVVTFYPAVGNATLRDSLGFKGGSGGSGAAKTLVRAGTAALLDAAHPDIDYPSTEAAVLAAVNNALLRPRAEMLALAAQLDADNSGVCPLG